MNYKIGLLILLYVCMNVWKEGEEQDEAEEESSNRLRKEAMQQRQHNAAAAAAAAAANSELASEAGGEKEEGDLHGCPCESYTLPRDRGAGGAGGACTPIF